MKKIYIIGGTMLVVIVLMGLSIILSKAADNSLGQVIFHQGASDVVGTKVGTTTTGVGFYGANTGTSTYVSKIDGTINTAVYTILFKAASSTPATGASNLHVSLLASNDDYCNTATTTTIYDVVTMDQINWFDAAPFITGITDASSQLTPLAGTSTLVLNTTAMQGRGKQILLTNLNAQCLALQVNSSSTLLHIQLKTK